MSENMQDKPKFILKDPATGKVLFEFKTAVGAIVQLVQMAPPYGKTPVSIYAGDTWLFTVNEDRTQFDQDTYFILLKMVFALARHVRTQEA